MPSLGLTLEYDGRDFAGWQRQAQGQRTVQGTLEEALARILGRPAPVVGAGRTDAGVHAEGQVASVALEGAEAAGPRALAPAVLARALNAGLPGDLAVREVWPAPEGFHARRDALGKLYRYRIWNGRAPSPLRSRHTHAVARPLDLDAMAEAAASLVGTHDFASFQTRGSLVRHTERTLRRVEVCGERGAEVWLEVEGNGFLRHMVRALAGTLLQVGLGRRAPDSLGRVLAARSRGAAGPNAPAAGLCLIRVEYGFRRNPGPLDSQPG